MNHRVLIIGVGSIGERHVRCFAQTNRVELSICEINSKLRDKISGLYNVSDGYADLDQALNRPPDIAVICAPADVHVPIAIRLAAANVHLMIEKPLSTSMVDVDELKTAIAQKNLTVAVAYVNRLHPLLQSMRQELLSGRYGAPLQLVATAGQNFPFYRPAYREIYYNDHATGGGAVQDALTHVIDAAQWLVGPITEVVADVAHQCLAGVTVEDTAHVIARHGEVMAAYSLNQYQAPNESTISVVCQKGTLRFEPHLLRWRFSDQPEQPWQEETVSALERDELFVRQANMFLDAVEQKKPVICSIDEAEQNLRVGLAILESAKTRTWQSILNG